jgi:hypothetical protein
VVPAQVAAAAGPEEEVRVLAIVPVPAAGQVRRRPTVTGRSLQSAKNSSAN